MTSIRRSIENVRHSLADTALVTFAVVDLIVVPIAMLRSLDFGWDRTLSAAIAFGILTITAAIFRNRLAYNIKATGMIALIFLAGLSTILRGMPAESTLLILLASVLAVTFYGTRHGVVLITVGAISIIARGLAATLGYSVLTIDYSSYIHSFYSWISLATTLAAFGIIVIMTQGGMLRMLENTINEVRILEGLIPICANCKKIRDDEGYWNQIEVFITKHSEAEFTHGICGDCAEQLYPAIGLSTNK